MTGAHPIPSEPARRAALRAALIRQDAPQADIPDLDDVTKTGESESYFVTAVCVQFTPQQAEAIVAVANALHYAGALSQLLPDRNEQKAFRVAVKALKFARMKAVRRVTPEEAAP